MELVFLLFLQHQLHVEKPPFTRLFSSISMCSNIAILRSEKNPANHFEQCLLNLLLKTPGFVQITMHMGVS
jgi:hypothetical protein